eukprot:GFKZ01007427.1.p1 GENE.GFKZ01007427.1~~GFKZ01007427.1.p1  ORF type:complete len:411 (-),score=46.34 GFKZ01007427.1:331-1497(-)
MTLPTFIAPLPTLARAPISLRTTSFRHPLRPQTRSIKAPARIQIIPTPHVRPTPTRMVAEDAGASRAPASAPLASAVTGESASKATVALLFGLWYLFNIIFNILNKRVLNAWSNPWILSTVQLGVGSIMVLLQWALKLQRRPNLSPKLIKALFLPTLSHLVGHVSTCISFSYVAVSFSHIVKACEPAFGAVGSALVLGEVYSPGVYATLLPIIAGVALSAVTQIQFSWPGFLFAMLSNVAFASRNIFSKLTMGDFKKDETLTPQNIYGIMSVMALIIELPFALAIEGLPRLPSQQVGYLLGWSGVFYTLYNTVSFMALGKTGVVTHAVGNILKRASVIIVSILVFRTPVKLLNGVGMGVALVGTCLYSLVKQRFLAKKKEQAASGKSA